jgi:DNA replication and repair protein RecF
MRLASLLFRIAQVQSYREKTGKFPIVLIDDVLLELDMTKRELFLDKLGGYSQAFFTFLPDEHYFSEMGAAGALTYRVEDGTFMPV